MWPIAKSNKLNTIYETYSGLQILVLDFLKLDTDLKEALEKREKDSKVILDKRNLLPFVTNTERDILSDEIDLLENKFKAIDSLCESFKSALATQGERIYTISTMMSKRDRQYFYKKVRDFSIYAERNTWKII